MERCIHSFPPCNRFTDPLCSTIYSTFHHNQDGSELYHHIVGGYAWHRTKKPDPPSEEENSTGPDAGSGRVQGPQQTAGPSTLPNPVKVEETHRDDTDSQLNAKPTKSEDDMEPEEQQVKLEVFDDDTKQFEPFVAFNIDSAVGPASDSNSSESGSGADSGGVKRNKRRSARLNLTASRSIDPETMRVTRSVCARGAQQSQ